MGLFDRLKRQLKDTSALFWEFFVNYFWLGLSLIFIAVYFNTKLSDPDFEIKVVIEMVKTVGITIMVAAIFTFASGTSQFITKITKLLQSIVVTRDFLGDIDSRSKKDALAALIKPSHQEREIYGNIQDYYNFYIAQTLAVSEKSVRSEFSIIARAFMDEEQKKVAIVADLVYRLHPTSNGYTDIPIRLDSEHNQTRCEWIKISTPDGDQMKIETEFKDDSTEGRDVKTFTIPAKEYGKNFSHLRIDGRIIEYGEDHWISNNFIIVLPTDGFRYTLRCEDGLKIKSHYTYVYGAQVYVQLSPDKDEIIFSCDQWLNEGTGLAVVIALPDAHVDADEKPSNESPIQVPQIS